MYQFLHGTYLYLSKRYCPSERFCSFLFFLSVPYSDRLLLFWVCGTEMFGKLLAFCSYESSVVSCWRLKLHWSVLCKPFSYLLFTSVLQGCNFDLLIWLQLAVLKNLMYRWRLLRFQRAVWLIDFSLTFVLNGFVCFELLMSVMFHDAYCVFANICLVSAKLKNDLPLSTAN